MSPQIVARSKMRSGVAGGSTALDNAVYIALKELNKMIRDEPLAESRRRAIVILSDGEDTSSLVAFDEVSILRRARTRPSMRLVFLAYESSNARRDRQFRGIAVKVERSGTVARALPFLRRLNHVRPFPALSPAWSSCGPGRPDPVPLNRQQLRLRVVDL